MAKEKGMVLVDWAAKSEATLVLVEPGHVARRAARGGGQEKVAGVEVAGLVKIVGRAMEGVAPALGDDLRLRAGVAAEFRVEVVRNQLEFLHAVIAEGAEARFSRCREIAGDDAVYGDVVGPAAGTI